MTGDLEPHMDVSDELEIKLGIPGMMQLRWQRSWKPRMEKVVDEAAVVAGVTVTELGGRMHDSERFADAFFLGVNRGAEVGDADYQTAIGRLVGAAYDDARIDEVEFMLAEVVKLEPVHLRALLAPWRYYRRSGGPIELVPVDGPQWADLAVAQVIDESELVRRLKVSAPTAATVIDRLAFNGFFETQLALPGLGGATVSTNISGGFSVSEWGAEIIRRLFPRLTVQKQG